MKYLCILFFLLIGISCAEKREIELKEFKEFPTQINLIHEEVPTPDVLSMVGEIEFLDSILVIINLKSDVFFQVFKLPGFNYLGGFIKKGNGPNEETAIDPYIRYLYGNSFIYRTMRSVKVASFNLKENKINISKTMNLPGKLLNLNQVFMIDNIIYGYNLGMTSKKEFVGYNPKTGAIFDYGATYPQVGEKIPSELNSNFFTKVTAIKPDKTQFASVYDLFPILRIYSTNGRLGKEILYKNGQQFPDGILENHPSKASINKVMQNYRKIKTTDNFIYALYNGKTIGESNSKADYKGLDDFSNEIHVWDWEGNPIMKILLDKNIFSFCVSPDDKYLICSSINSLNKFFKYYIYGFDQ